MPEKNNGLELRFDPRTIEHLGIKMYSQLPQALAELIANAYDADASEVRIDLYDNDPSNKKIIVSDDGIGMSYDDVKDKFLVIGRKRRDTDSERTTSKGRVITGRKGVGKLALFGIGNNIEVETSIKGEPQRTKFALNWRAILEEQSGVYSPYTVLLDKNHVEDHGTKITLSQLTRVSSFDLENTAISLSKMFNFIDSEFKIFICKNGSEENAIQLTRELRYKGMQSEFKWDVLNDILPNIDTEYAHKDNVKGMIVSSPEGKVMRQDLRGVTLYVNGRMANTPSFFGLGETPHAFSYLSGWIDADFLDELSDDIIATDRQSISWDLPEAEDLQRYLKKVVNFTVKKWEEGRREKKNKKNTEKTGVDLDKWYSTLPNQKMKDDIEHIVNKVSDNVNIDSEEYVGMVKKLHEIIPDYPYYHWRELHSQIQDASKKLYQEDKDYYAAFCEAMKRYKNAVKAKSGVDGAEDSEIVSKAFGDKKPLITTAKYTNRPDGQPFEAQTLKNIEEGQKFLSMGCVAGGRNVVSHEEHKDLKETGLFTEKDCLDLLSLLSHLFKRLDEAEKRS